MPVPRKFDYDAAKRRFLAGEPKASIARSFGVTPTSIARAVDPVVRKRMAIAAEEYLRRSRPTCLGGCGKLVWMHNKSKNPTGYCSECLAKKRREERVPKHGTESEYTLGCRCDLCRQASRVGREARRSRRWVKLQGGAVPAEHGTEWMYNSGCRCSVCRKAASETRKDRTARAKNGENARKSGEPLLLPARTNITHETKEIIDEYAKRMQLTKSAVMKEILEDWAEAQGHELKQKKSNSKGWQRNGS